ncbi:cell division protein FtsZ [Aquimarina sp. MMG015]|uniref:cell division protein FtsZ n=1 Tax=unclassified Aquimarina TaxID=2627091 RepID=UPI000E4FB2E8|nr:MULTISPECIES: cell division protein FtsZ [unclassified Aquimarina]AXT58093.1 cell division protein FtsZ [Aquimarina sp. AD1]MBQ4803004.1 cell division protein FtsZ [Aquimarina sp. MMG015]RKN37247.1 cell division protein FtsZ [Aquimarina sp. AD1]
MSDNEEFENISFDLPKNQSNVIKVIGVGGGGSNAINHMFQQGIKGVDFVICNTDAQALENSPIPNKIQLGVSLTEGLGAGANPEVGEQSAVESYEEIKRMLDTNTKMIFITAGMGGGTGTGAAPIIAKMARELDILTVGIVTIPFQFEGKMRNEQAQLGVEKLRAHVDSLVVINNNKLREVYGNLGFKAGFSKADEVLATASRGIAEVITHHYTQNIDLRDAKTVLSNSGTAIMGSANASGAKRAHDAIVKALDSPLLNDNKITGAKNVLLLIVSGKEEITIDEIGEINDHIQQEAGHGANIIMGVGEDESLEDAISVTVIATGFDVEQQDEIVNTETKRIIHTLEEEQRATTQDLTPKSTSKSTPEITPVPQKEVVKEEPIIIKHELIEEEEEDINESLLLPTTEFLKNIDVVDHEEVSPFSVDSDFVIINAQDIINQIEVNDANEIALAKEEQEKEEDQFTLAFDMPVSGNEEQNIEAIDPTPPVVKQEEEEKPIVFDLTDDILEVEVNEPIEVVPVSETVAGGVRKYSLEEYMEEEKRLTDAKPAAEVIEEDKEVAFEKKTVAPTPEQEPSENADPVDQPISETLKARAAERRAKMKEFNYKFRNNASNIDDIEKEPAYKRAGLDVDSKPGSSELSRTSLGTDSNDDIQLRKNNSFLHDNVD